MKNMKKQALYKYTLAAVFATIIGLVSIQHNLYGKHRTPQQTILSSRILQVAEPKVSQVVIISYQRAGSSFTGSLFDRHPDVFFVYEPLDSVYSALYGTAEGWNTPSDILVHSNGTKRELPGAEIQAMSHTLTAILHCDFHSLMPEVLLSRFWTKFAVFQQSNANYSSCLGGRRYSGLKQCQEKHLHCGKRFNEQPDQDSQCFEELKNNTNVNVHLYRQCIQNLFKSKEKCVRQLYDACMKSKVRAIKTVRASMDIAKKLLETNPNMKILHLHRDPRPVARSRMNNTSFRSFRSGTDYQHEAYLYCATLKHDLDSRKELETKYPGHFKELIYENLTQNLYTEVLHIYDFVNIAHHEPTLQWVKNASQQAKLTSQSWKNEMSVMQSENILVKCQ